MVYTLCFRFSPSLNEVVFQDVQAAHHLRKDEHFVSTGLHLGKQLVNENEFTCRLNHSLQVEIYSCGAIHLLEVLKDLLLGPYK